MNAMSTVHRPSSRARSSIPLAQAHFSCNRNSIYAITSANLLLSVGWEVADLVMPSILASSARLNSRPACAQPKEDVMKRIVAVLLLIVLLSFVLAQEVQYRRDTPKPFRFSKSEQLLLRRSAELEVSAVAGVTVGLVSGSAKVSCQFTTITCDGSPVIHASIPVLGHEHVCDGWVRARDAIAAGRDRILLRS